MPETLKKSGKNSLIVNSPKHSHPAGICYSSAALPKDLQHKFALRRNTTQPPSIKIVKALNNKWCGLMVNPKLIKMATTTVLLAAKMSRQGKPFNYYTEIYLPLWPGIIGATNNSALSIKIIS